MRFAVLAASAVSCSLLVAGLLPPSALAEEKLRISLETAPNHIRNLTVGRFAEDVMKRVPALKVEIFHSAQLHPDRDVPKALRQGTIEMGVPGAWQIDKIEPNAAIVDLPAFYGLPEDAAHGLLEGEIGRKLNSLFERKLQVKIPGAWLPLGFGNTFTTGKELKVTGDFKGMKIRIPGGAINIDRYKAFGANAVLVPWPDVPLALSQGAVEGLYTTFESVRSAQLWDAGVKYAYVERVAVLPYIPMIGLGFWNRQKPEVQEHLLAAWKDAVTWGRANARLREQEAMKLAEEKGIKVFRPRQEDLDTARRALLAIQPDLVRKMGLDPQIVDEIVAELKKAGAV
ncbi:MAG: TRAP transporter substrate-binding protein DctP [Alphaproteobacteria bacterium]|nr:TRAP transporter substrate-binding protein DctP [Alphaproteobacteria bacterium]